MWREDKSGRRRQRGLEIEIWAARQVSGRYVSWLDEGRERRLCTRGLQANLIQSRYQPRDPLVERVEVPLYLRLVARHTPLQPREHLLQVLLAFTEPLRLCFEHRERVGERRSDAVHIRE